MIQHNSKNSNTIRLFLALAVGMSLSAAVLVGGYGRGTLTLAEPILVMSDFAGSADNDVYAQFPEVFIGSIDEKIGDYNISEEGAALFVPLFSVDVDRTVFGQATGQISVSVYKDEYTEEMAENEVVVGHRYLFATDLPDGSGVYHATEGFGVIAVRSDAEADALEAEFRRLRVEESALTVQSFPTPDPCDAQTDEPTIDVSPRVTKAGREIRVTVENAAKLEVGIYWQNLRNRIGIGKVRDDCTAVVTVEVPRNARPGVYEVIVADARALQDKERIVIED